MAPAPLLATISIPTAAQCLAVLAPIIAFLALRWLLARIDRMMHHLFPSQEWERQLGWFNIRDERRASAFLRWLGYVAAALLAAALYGIAWGAVALRELKQWNDPLVLGQIATRLPVLFTCLALWLFYLLADLLPRLRRDDERRELEKFRAEQAALEATRATAPSRIPSSLLPHSTKGRDSNKKT